MRIGPLAPALGFLLAVAAQAHAQDGNPPRPAPDDAPTEPLAPATPATDSPPSTPPSPIELTFRPFGSHTFRADLRDGAGDVAVTRAGLGLDLAARIGDRARLTVALLTEASRYDFGGAGGIVPGVGDPFSDVYRINLRPTIYVSESRQFLWFVGGIAEVAGESGVNVGDALSGGGFGGVRYSFSENFALTLGVAAKSRLEESALVLPLVGVTWNLSDTTRFSLNSLVARFESDLHPDLTFFIDGGWELRDYRLEDDGPIPAGVVHDVRVPVGAGFVWTASDRLKVELSGGAVVWQRFRIDDNDSNRVGEEHTDPAPFVRLEVSINF